MTAHLPPVPPANRTDKGGGAHGPAKNTGEKALPHEAVDNIDEQGDRANVRQNTTHPGQTQDR